MADAEGKAASIPRRLLAWLRNRRRKRPQTARGAPGAGTMQARVHKAEDGTQVVDVRGQTCPGYLLAIDRAVRAMGPGTAVRLLVTYPPCADDVRAWCAERGHELLDIERRQGHFAITLRTAAASRSGRK